MSKTITYIFVGIGLAVVALFAIKSCTSYRSDLQTVKSLLNDQKQQAEHWRDKYNTEHSTVQQLQVNKKVAEVYFKQNIDSMAALLKIKPKQVKSIVYVPFQADINIDSLKDALAHTDTLKVPVRDTIIQGRVKVNGIMSITKYDKGTGFLNLKKRQYLDVHFDNPIFKPLNVTGFDITSPVRHWSIGPYVGYGWNGDRWSPQLGFSIQYSLIKF